MQHRKRWPGACTEDRSSSSDSGVGGDVIGSQHELGSTVHREGAMGTAAITASVSACERCLRETGIIGALRFLNERTRYRYTGLYHVEPPMLRNVHLFDRENPTLNVSGELTPLRETFCGVVWSTNDALLITDALADARFVAHPARERVLSYSGIPVRAIGELPWGSLCHFDVRPRLHSAHESRIMEGVAPLIARWLGDQPS